MLEESLYIGRAVNRFAITACLAEPWPAGIGQADDPGFCLAVAVAEGERAVAAAAAAILLVDNPLAVVAGV